MRTTPARRKHRASSSDTARDYASPSPDAHPPGKQQIRHRASVACASCRERRIRCVVPPGQTECTQCNRAGTECIIKNDDERRRPISKAYMSSLSNRIALLEGMLKERGVVPPPAAHPPKTRQEALRQQEEQTQAAETPQPRVSTEQPPTPPSSAEEDADMAKPKREESAVPASHPQLCMIEPSLLQDFEPKHDSSVRHLLAPRGRLSFDQSAGRVRFFGPTANIHVYAESSCHFDSRDPEQARRADSLIRTLPSSTHSYLMTCFWEYFNTSHQVVDQATFEADRVSQDPKFYSTFLHVAILAAGYRFADRSREDIKRLTAGNWESTLHRQVKSMLSAELEKPSEVSSVQALLILADLECGVGRDTQGWMYSGMANRLAFDIGLHVNCSDAISETERRVRRQAMAACVMLDRQLAVLLGRPASIKGQDIGVNLAPKELSLSLDSALVLDLGAKPTPNDAAVHHHLMELMGLTTNMTDSYNLTQNPTDMAGLGSRYMQVVALDRQLQNWYRCLPSHLAWNPANAKAAPLSYFLLHQQFHVCMILLHLPWARYGPGSGGADSRYSSPASGCRSDDSGFTYGFGAPLADDGKLSATRSTCTQHAIRVARIFWQHRQRFDGKKLGLMAVQHAGTAALALMGALAHQSRELDHQSNLRYLQVLSSAIYDMSQTYHPAARMYHLLKSMLVDIRKEMVNSRRIDADLMLRQYRQSISGVSGFSATPWGAGRAANMYSVLPAIQEAAGDAECVPAAKKRRLSERRPSELELTSQSLFGNGFTYPSPPTTTQSRRPFTDEKESCVSASVGEESFNLDFDFLSGTVVEVDPPTQTKEAKPQADTIVAAPTARPEPSVESKKPAENPPTPAPQSGPEDDDTAEMTIEEWLAEPRVMTPMSLQQGVEEAKSEWMEEVEKEDMNLDELVQEAVGGIKTQTPVRNLELDFLSL